jgi:hypothetical protein
MNNAPDAGAASAADPRRGQENQPDDKIRERHRRTLNREPEL